MATRTVDESNEERKRELEAAMARCVAAELACSSGGSAADAGAWRGSARSGGRVREGRVVSRLRRSRLSACPDKDGIKNETFNTLKNQTPIPRRATHRQPRGLS